MNIGLTQRIFYHKTRAYDSLEHGWYSYLEEHTLFFIQNRVEQDFKSIAKDLDLLIITGGDDSSVRRITETKLAREMVVLGKPILGICHGAFLLTDLLNGDVDECANHIDTEHKVITSDGIYIVNSFHTMIIKEAPSTAKVVAKDVDGNCEAWIDGNIAAVVWHPERMDKPYLPKEIASLTGLI